MIEALQVKVCGLTSLADARYAAACGADYFGINLHAKSPRCVSPKFAGELAAQLPRGRRVAVVVEPDPGALAGMHEAGFDRFQVHFRAEMPIGTVSAWSREVGPDNLWLAPKLPPKADVSEAWLGLSDCLLIDTYDPDLFGGTGRTGDWPKFRRLREAHPEKTWILSGGLNPDNVERALLGTGARFVDVNSGIESAPGVKDHGRMKAFFAAARRAAGPQG